MAVLSVTHIATGWQFGNTDVVALAGGHAVIGISNATTLPTSLLSGTGSGLVMYSNNGQLEIDGYGINFHALSQTPGIYQTAASSDVVPQNMTISPQGPYASAVTNLTSGSVNINFPLPKSGTTRGLFNLQENGVTYLTMSDRATAAGTGYGKIWLGSGQSGANASDNNYALAGTANDTFLNSTGDCLISIGGNQWPGDRLISIGGNQWIRVAGGGTSNRGIVLGYPGNADYGNGDNVVCIPAALTNPTSNSATSSNILYTETTSFQFKNRGHLGAVTTLAPAGSSGTINTQAQIIDVQVGTARTVSSATVTTVLTLATASTTSGVVSVTCISRAITAPSSGAIGDTYAIVKEFTYRNVAGTLTIVGTNITGAAITDTSVTTTSFTITTSGTNILIQVANVASATIDSQVVADITVC